MSLEGRLLQCGKTVAFKVADFPNAVIFISGLGDHMLSLGYTEDLAAACVSKGFSFITIQLRSQPDYKMHPIEDDIEDLEAAISLVSGKAILIGHSTGCQVALLRNKKNRCKKVVGIVLQGPVSDIEAYEGNRMDLHWQVEEAKKAGKYYCDILGSMWLSQRFISMYEAEGKEDLFSSYLNLEQFQKLASSVPILSVLSGKDEYVKICLREKFKQMGDVVVIEQGNHCLTEHFGDFIKAVIKFLGSL